MLRTLCGILLLGCWLQSASAAEAVTFENVVPVTANKADEPIAKTYSKEKAIHFIDSASVHWTKTRKCFTCHTNFAYLMAKPLVSELDEAHNSVRTSLDKMVTERWEKQGPRWDAEIVMSAMILAFNDSVTTKTLSPTAKTALARMWKVQTNEGGFDWLKCGWPPMESDDEFGAAIALIATGIAPDDYKNSEEAIEGIKKLKSYFKNHENPTPTLHHRAMLLWASTMIDGFLDAQKKQAVIKQLLEQQKADGGWALASLGDWTRADKKPQDIESSDGYATGFVIYVLRQAGVKADHERLQKGIAWLKSNQRESGRWYTRSLNRDNKHFISHAGTAFALLALSECEETAK